MRPSSRQLLLAAWLALAALPAVAENWIYTVRPGDDLWTLAARYCGSASFAPRIAAANGLADQSLIRPGMRLQLPVEWLVRQPVTAGLVAVRGEVSLLVPAPRQARVGEAIGMGQVLRTGDGAAVVEFADGSTLQVSDDSEVLFNVLTAFGDTGMVDTHLRFLRGRSTSRVQRRHQGSRFRISTPSGTAAVRGTEFRVGIDAETMLTESLEGEVGFRQDQEISLPAGTGLAASPGQLTREPLLEAPRWVVPTGPVALGEELRWQPVAGARRYRVSAFAAADPRTPLLERLVDGDQLVLQGLGLGDHELAVRGVSASGLEGFDARLAIEVRSPAPELVATVQTVRGATRLSWQPTRPPYTVQVAGMVAGRVAGMVASQDAGEDPFVGARTMAVDAPVLALPDLAAGRYRWRVRDASSVYAAPDEFTVLPPPVTGLRGRTERLAATLSWAPVANADGYRLTLREAGDPAAVLRTLELTEASAEVDLPGYRRFEASVVSVENGLASEPAALELRPQPRAPWWLLAGLFLGLLAL